MVILWTCLTPPLYLAQIEVEGGGETVVYPLILDTRFDTAFITDTVATDRTDARIVDFELILTFSSGLKSGTDTVDRLT